MSALDLVNQLRRMEQDIRRLGRGIARAQLDALDATAMDVRDAEVREIDDSFDRPTPYTRNAIFVRKTQNKVPLALVGIKDDVGGNRGADRWLKASIEGGSRVLKSFERSLRSLGIMDGDQFVKPGRYANIDAYGNISRGQIVQILSQLRAFTGAETVARNLVKRDGTRDKGSVAATAEEARRLRNKAFRKAGGQYFAVGPYKRGDLWPGIYQRQVANRNMVGPASPKPRLVMLFITPFQYEQRFDFWRAGELAIERSYPKRFAEALARHAGRPTT